MIWNVFWTPTVERKSLLLIGIHDIQDYAYSESYPRLQTIS